MGTTWPLLACFGTLCALMPVSHGRVNVGEAQNAASSCCPRSVDCCRRAILNRMELNCFGANEDSLSEAVSCIHRHLFGEHDFDRLNTNDLPCCSVFTLNANDPSDECASICRYSILAPGIRATRRLSTIKGCAKGKTLAKCFDTCLAFLKDHDYMTPFRFSKHCSWRDRMVPGEMYIGPSRR